jgi:transaldolase
VDVTAESPRIQDLARQGQSVWLDNLGRKLISSGELVRLRDAGVTGITSNPTIFEKAISGSSDYDDGLADESPGGWACSRRCMAQSTRRYCSVWA